MSHRFIVLVCAVLAPIGLWAAPLRTSPTEAVHDAEAHRGGWFSLDADSAHSYDQIALSLDYRVEDAAANASGWAYLTIVSREVQSQIPFNAEGLQIQAVTLGNQPLTYTQNADTCWVQLAMNVNDTATLAFQVSVPPQDGPWDVGYHQMSEHVYTFAEPYGARRWYPCWDQPYDKFDHVTIAVNMPDYWSLASNGLLMETTFPEAGRKREVYQHDYPIASYLVMIAAGDYTRRYETVDNVLYRYITFPADSADAVYDWGRTPEMVAFYDQSFGPYPFNAYGMVQVGMNGGAMEHQTMTSVGRNLVTGDRRYEGVVAHELAHQWFGDWLSPVDFRNIWLNEGFATYCTALYYEHAEGEDLFQQILETDARNYIAEDHWRRYAMYDPPFELMFGRVEYEKGGWVLHMLRRQLLGDSLFFRTMQTYVSRFGGGNVSTEDFISVVNEVSGQNLHWFFDQWVYQAGHPVLQIAVQAGVPTSRDVTVSVQQLQTNAPIFQFPLEVDVTTAEGTVTRQFWFNQQNQAVTQTFGSDVQSAVLRSFQPLLYESPLAADDPRQPVARQFALDAVYPNPFNATARIPFELPVASDVRVDVYDLTGRLVETLTQGRYEAGRHELTFAPGSGMASGIYWITLSAGGYHQRVKAVFLK